MLEKLFPALGLAFPTGIVRIEQQRQIPVRPESGYYHLPLLPAQTRTHERCYLSESGLGDSECIEEAFDQDQPVSLACTLA